MTAPEDKKPEEVELQVLAEIAWADHVNACAEESGDEVRPIMNAEFKPVWSCGFQDGYKAAQSLHAAELKEAHDYGYESGHYDGDLFEREDTEPFKSESFEEFKRRKGE